MEENFTDLKIDYPSKLLINLSNKRNTMYNKRKETKPIIASPNTQIHVRIDKPIPTINEKWEELKRYCGIIS